MSLKAAACPALTGMSFLTLVLLVHLMMDGQGYLNGVVPVMRLGASLVRVFAGFSLATFLYVFYKKTA